MGDDTSPTNSTNTTANTAASGVDSNHSYYFHLSDSPRLNLISAFFDGKGFLGWRRSILIALSAKRKLDFINGACKISDLTSSNFSQWSCCNDMVISWLLNVLSNGAKLFHLQKQLNTLVQGNSDISRYFTKINRL